MPLLIIFSDLDGTLLDHDTYQWEKARPALQRCSAERVPVIMVSSKTRAEMDRLRRKMGIEAPFVSENGGGIFFPPGLKQRIPPEAEECDGLWKWKLGADYATVIKVLDELRSELTFPVRGFHEMKPLEISRITGLDILESLLASTREFDEPFMAGIQTPSDEMLLQRAVARRGMNLSKGGRFYHLYRHGGKEDAVRKLITWYKNDYADIVTMALGDSPNDFAMLDRVDHPVLVKSCNSYPELHRRIKRLKLTPTAGPGGWNTAVIDLLDKLQGGSNEQNP
jgi:mannosyl-3-phosphoglycerate phosphatase